MNSQILSEPIQLPKILKKIKIGIFTPPEIDTSWGSFNDEAATKAPLDIKHKWLEIVEILKNKFATKDVTFKRINSDKLFFLYKAIAFTDGMTNRAKDVFTLKNSNEKKNFFGDYYDIAINNRTNCYSFDMKRKIISGSIMAKLNDGDFVKKAFRILNDINNEVNELYKEYDIIIWPTSGSIAPTYNEGRLTYTNSAISEYLKLGNFCGFPSIHLPVCDIQKLPWGICINAKRFDDQLCLDSAHTIYKLLKKELKK